MLGKVALRNIRRSVKDYAIYFVTLLIGGIALLCVQLYFRAASND